MPVHENDNGIEKAAKGAAFDAISADRKVTRRFVGAQLLVVALVSPPLFAMSYQWLEGKFGLDVAIVAFLTLVSVGLTLSLAGAFLLKRTWWMPLLFGIVFVADLAGSILWFFWHNFRM